MPDLVIEKHPDKKYMLFRFNRPDQLNALTPAMQQELQEGVAELAADPEMRVGILTGTGRAFSAGADLKAMAERNAAMADLDAKVAAGVITAEERRSRLRDLGIGSAYGVDAIPRFPFAACPKPVIAAINGICVAGGMEMAIDCDIRIASTEAYFGVFEAKRGIIAGVAVQHLARVMPVGEAMRLLVTCDKMSAERAYQVGFVQEVVEPGALMERAVAMAETIGANAPLSVQASKAMVQFWRHFGVEEARRLEEYVWRTVFESEDAKEGPRAFAEKRAPRWTGR